MPFVKVAGVNELKPGEGKMVAANGLEIALFNVNGTFHAIENTCSHRGGPLGEGMLDGDIVTCPWHGWRYDVKTGISVVMPSISVRSFEVKVEGEDVLVNI
jgi:nitrite reductase/ring-hydroxylating ferredoxin subunit